MRRIAWIVGLIVLSITTPALARDASGTWEAAGELTFTLVVEQATDGRIVGRLSGGGMLLELEGRTEAGGFAGTLTGGGVVVDLRARFDGLRLRLEVVDPDALASGEAATMILNFRRLASPDPAGAVVVNGEILGSDETEALERQHRVSIEPGRYWYDAACGAWGLEGGPTAGFLQAGLPVGGPLRVDASAGKSGVFVNRRELHRQDVAALEAAIGTVVPGRYWLDAAGNVGLEGGPMVFNLIGLSRSTAGQGGEAATYRSNITGIGAGGAAGTSYVMGKDWAVVVGD